MKKLISQLKELQDNPSSDKREQDLKFVNLLIAHLQDKLNELEIKYEIHINKEINHNGRKNTSNRINQ